MLQHFTASILNLILDMSGDIFIFYFSINVYCVVNLLLIIFYHLLCCAMFFLAFCVLSPWLSLSVTLSIHLYINLYLYLYIYIHIYTPISL